MGFRIRGLDPAPFAPLFELGAEALSQRGIVRETITDYPGAPCRITLDDVAAGADVLLLSHQHQPAASPYQQAGPIFVSQARQQVEVVNDIPPALARRMISVRGYDEAGMMRFGDLVDGADLAAQIEAVLADPAIAYAHAHYAKRGCYAALITRA